MRQFVRFVACAAIFAAAHLAGATGALAQQAGSVAVVEDDGSLFVKNHNLNVNDGDSLTLTPAGDDAFSVREGGATLHRPLGRKLTSFVRDAGAFLPNRGYAEVPFSRGFTFTLYGQTYDRMFVGTNGSVTFGSGDCEQLYGGESIARLRYGQPRVAPYWTDFETRTSVKGAGIFVRQERDAVYVTWNKLAEYDSEPRKNTVQLQLFADGRVAFVYDRIEDNFALVAVSPGGNRSGVSAVDWKESAGGQVSGATYEWFNGSGGVFFDYYRLGRKFYAANADAYDFLFAFGDGQPDMPTSIRFVRNDIQGVGLYPTDSSGAYGNPRQLQSVHMLGNLGDYPDDPTAPVAAFGGRSALAHLARSQGLRWAPWIKTDSGDFTDSAVVRLYQGWTWYVNTPSAVTDRPGGSSSVLGGNAIRDNGDGTFTTVQESVDYYSPLDLYLMGLYAPEEVPATFAVLGSDEARRAADPQSGVTFPGSRKDITIGDVIAFNGPRVPDVSASQKRFRAAFVLVTHEGTAPSPEAVAKLERLRLAWEAYFSRATGGRASVSTDLAAARP